MMRIDECAHEFISKTISNNYLLEYLGEPDKKELLENNKENWLYHDVRYEIDIRNLSFSKETQRTIKFTYNEDQEEIVGIEESLGR